MRILAVDLGKFNSDARLVSLCCREQASCQTGALRSLRAAYECPSRTLQENNTMT